MCTDSDRSGFKCHLGEGFEESTKASIAHQFHSPNYNLNNNSTEFEFETITALHHTTHPTHTPQKHSSHHTTITIMTTAIRTTMAKAITMK